MTRHPEQRPEPAPKAASRMAGLLALLAFAGLAFSIFSIPDSVPDLRSSVLDALDASGVQNPVTAVLLNFRSYDTLLEMAVLLLALAGAIALAPAEDWESAKAGRVLDALARMLMPVMVLLAGYLLWTGKYTPGGAFQAGAVLAAAGVLALLTGFRTAPHPRVLRLTSSLGVAAFLLTGAGVMVGGRNFLEYPQALAGSLILLIETAATLAIAMTLVALFRGGHSGAGR